MIYRYKMKFTTKSLPVYLLAIGLPVAGISAFFWTTPIAAILLLGVALFIDYQIIKTVNRITRARIVTYTEGFSVYMSDGTKMEFDWDKVDYSGVVTNGERPGIVFAYNEADDKIVQLPPIFSDFEAFVEELKENTPYQEYQLDEGEATIVDHLKAMLGVGEDDEDEDSVQETE